MSSFSYETSLTFFSIISKFDKIVKCHDTSFQGISIQPMIFERSSFPDGKKKRGNDSQSV